ncbi:MAG TPA: hypothetical protein VL354_10380 [Spirochaetia bacterium]|nr:hypothetical protein [Spirochaetia bacterium]
MKPSTRDILFIFVGLFVSIGTLWASRAGVEMRLGRDVAYLNRIGRSPTGEKSLSLSLESRFRPGPGQIAELHKQRLGYGDISVVLAVASWLHGGVTRQNIERIVSLWKSPRSGSWSKIARSLGVRVDRVVLQIESLRGAQTKTAVGATASRTPGHDPVLRLVHGG